MQWAHACVGILKRAVFAHVLKHSERLKHVAGNNSNVLDAGQDGRISLGMRGYAFTADTLTA